MVRIRSPAANDGAEKITKRTAAKTKIPRNFPFKKNTSVIVSPAFLYEGKIVHNACYKLDSFDEIFNENILIGRMSA